MKRSEKGVVIQVELPFGRSMWENEEVIQEAVNAVGREATAESLRRFDTDGSPIWVGGMKFRPMELIVGRPLRGFTGNRLLRPDLHIQHEPNSYSSHQETESPGASSMRENISGERQCGKA